MEDLVFVNESLYLKIFSLEDCNTLFELVNQNRKHLSKYFPWAEQTKSVEDSKKFILSSISKKERGCGYEYGVYLENILVGSIKLEILKAKEAEVGYWIAKQMSKQNLATYALKELVSIAKVRLKLEKFFLFSDSENIASNKVAQKCEFQLIKSIEDKDLNKIENVWIYYNKT